MSSTTFTFDIDEYKKLPSKNVDAELLDLGQGVADLLVGGVLRRDLDADADGTSAHAVAPFASVFSSTTMGISRLVFF